MDKGPAGRRYHGQFKRPFRERERPDWRDYNAGGNHAGELEPGVFSLIRQLSETVVLPNAGLVLTFVMCYELIQMLIDRNNLHDIYTWIFFKWLFKTFVAVLLLSNTFNIVMAVFDVSQSVIYSAGGVIARNTAVSSDMLS